ncbi:MAG TPA: hypothetical protein VJV03_08365, partial [Pyrinomonadaceae bacterium]|nr:hypothetical protein [Pyrinomonadaceae bacterium]
VITIGQDAATLNGTVALSKGASPAADGLYVYLVPADSDQVNNALRYYETKVDTNLRFTISHVAPGRYFTTTRSRLVEATTTEWQSSELWDPAKRAELRRAAETSRNEIELKSCQRLNDYVLKVGAP